MTMMVIMMINDNNHNNLDNNNGKLHVRDYDMMTPMMMTIS